MSPHAAAQNAQPLGTGLKPPRDIVVVGGGVAAHRCAVELRALGFDGQIVMVSGEARLPYDRTLLSKDMLAVDALDEPISIVKPERYGQLGIDVRLESRAEWLETAERRVGLSDRSTLHYDRLILCVGGKPVVPPELDAPGVLVLREARHVAALREALNHSQSMVIIGGGFIGGEVAAAARAHGVAVTLIEAASQPLEQVVGAEIGERVATLHRQNGVELVLGKGAKAVTVSGSGHQVLLQDGSVIMADSVVVGVGMRPNTDWLAKSGVALDRGILTDASCRTSVPGILAAGDCARWWHPRYGGLCRVEHWDTANRHGVAVAATALGAERQFAPIPFFWSDQYGVKLQWAGYAPKWDRLVIEGEGARSFVARYVRHDSLVAVLSAGQPRLFAALRRELEEPTTVKETSAV